MARLRPTFVRSGQARSASGRFGFANAAFMDQVWRKTPWHRTLVVELAREAVAHRFDLLGSGRVTLSYDMTCKGLAGIRFARPAAPAIDEAGHWLAGRINSSNLAEAQRIWRLIDPAYVPIDWQLDFKSGYRWSESTWHGAIRFGHHLGADVKVPWELARLQHLPMLALAACDADSDAPEFTREVRNQLLDFIATNPPGFGVNWACAMDVGIRVANMVVAHDLLLAAGANLDVDFETIFDASVLAHARHIAGNLEWSPLYRGNHYLADLAGLLFAATDLPQSQETDGWLAFATRELLGEVGYQFHADGSNFEASTCYHRLSAEIVLWACALLDNLTETRLEALARPHSWNGTVPPRRPLPPLPMHNVPSSCKPTPISPQMRQQLAAMARFTRCVTRPDGLAVQFGDNDSGRFLILGSQEQRAWRDGVNPATSLDHRGLCEGTDSFLGKPSADAASSILATFAGRTGDAPAMDYDPQPCGNRGDDVRWDELTALGQSAPPGSIWRCEIPGGPGLRGQLEYQGFDGMGCYVLRSTRLFVAIRCGEIGVGGLGPHAHCDQLAIEVMVDGRSLIRDPGSYIYTALPDMRNRYRSVKSHHAPRHGDAEPANLTLGIFDLRGASAGECLYFGARGFVGRHRGYGFDVYRRVEVEDDRIIVIDFSPDGHTISDPTADPIDFSPGYGQIERMSPS